MLTEQIRNSYSEVFELLRHINRNDLSKIPFELLQTIKENRNMEYIPELDVRNLNKLSKKSKALFIWLYLNYITNNDEEKSYLNNILYENEKKYTTNLKLNNIFNEGNESKIDNKLIEYKESIFQKLIYKIKNFFCMRK